MEVLDKGGFILRYKCIIFSVKKIFEEKIIKSEVLIPKISQN